MNFEADFGRSALAIVEPLRNNQTRMDAFLAVRDRPA
jgi:hypothetical protein